MWLEILASMSGDRKMDHFSVCQGFTYFIFLIVFLAGWWSNYRQIYRHIDRQTVQYLSAKAPQIQCCLVMTLPKLPEFPVLYYVRGKDLLNKH